MNQFSNSRVILSSKASSFLVKMIKSDIWPGFDECKCVYSECQGKPASLRGDEQFGAVICFHDTGRKEGAREKRRFIF